MDHHKHYYSSPLTLILIIFIVSHYSSSFPQTTAKKPDQVTALSHIFQQKLKSPQTIDTTHFNATHHTFLGTQTYPQGLKDHDLIKSLPSQPSPAKFNQYGGYVTVDPDAGRAFYYYFVEAQHPTKDKDQLPLLLWLNGGPGCSSLAYGAMMELGPFRVNSDGKTLYQNKFAWNYGANVLFLESPAGVGFSYSNRTSDTSLGGDKRTAKDNYVFVLNWVEKFPDYKNREFYLSGESYAGHYVPQLAHLILYNNLKANKTIINLKGIIIGNAVINDETDAKGVFEYFGSHSIVSDEAVATVLKYCNFSPDAKKQSNICSDALSEVDTQSGDIDIYNIYAPVCKSSNLTRNPKKTRGKTIDPCSEYYVAAYFNRPEVQKAIHANVTNIPYPYRTCGGIGWEDSPVTIIPLLKELMANGIRVWIYSGDTDGRVPVTSTKKSIKKMNLHIKTRWHPWYIAGEVGGYTQVYKGDLTFATVRGAGHQVPSYEPARALSLIMHFLHGTHLPNSKLNN